MPPTGAIRPARLRTTMRRVRLEKVWTAIERASRAARSRRVGGGPSATSSATSSARPRSASAPGATGASASSLLEAISNAIERFDHLEVVVDLLELLAQALDMAVDGPVVDIDLVVI